MVTIYLIVGLLIAAVAVVLALQNTMTITIAFLAWKVTGSLSLILIVTLAIGLAIGLLVLTPSAVQRSIAVSSHRKRISALEKELDEHKQRLAALQEPRREIPQPGPAPTAASAAEPVEPKQ